MTMTLFICLLTPTLSFLSKDMLTVAKTTSPLGRGIQLGDVGDVATFLASDGARSITGQTLIVDCGQSILL